jgi:sensor histidine kinase YesM
MLLQPLVENSIKHGLAPKIGEGRILIRSTRANGHSIIDIIDNGVGVTHADNGVGVTHATSGGAAAKGQSERAHLTSGNGIGLQNVNERLRVIYGANYQLQLDSVPGGGTCARIVIPELAMPTKIPA